MKVLHKVHTSHNLDLGNTVAVPQDNTDLRGGGTLPVDDHQ